jgi:hypothetical protein
VLPGNRGIAACKDTGPKRLLLRKRKFRVSAGIATGLANFGVLPHVIEAVLNNVSGSRAGVAGIYNRARYEREVRAALEAWADHIATLTNTEPA